MSDLGTQLRAYLDDTAPPVELEEIFTEPVGETPVEPLRPRAPRRQIPGWAYAVAAAVIVLVVVGGMAWLAGGFDDGPPVVDDPSPTTTLAPDTEFEPLPAISLEQAQSQEDFVQFLFNSDPPDCSPVSGGRWRCVHTYSGPLLTEGVTTEVIVGSEGPDQLADLTEVSLRNAEEVRRGLEDVVAPLYRYALAVDRQSTLTHCALENYDQTAIVVWNPSYAAAGECGRHLAGMVGQFLVASAPNTDEQATRIARNFWAAIGWGDSERALAVTSTADWVDESSQGVVNFIDFLVAFNWFRDIDRWNDVFDSEGGIPLQYYQAVGDCQPIGNETRGGDPTTVVQCTVFFDHALFGRGGAQVEGNGQPAVIMVSEEGGVVYVDPPEFVMHQIELVYEWALANDPTATAAACSKARYTDQLVSANRSAAMAFHPDCGQYLNGLVPRYGNYVVQTFWQAIANGDGATASSLVTPTEWAWTTTTQDASLAGFFASFGWGGDASCDTSVDDGGVPAAASEFETSCTITPEHPLWPGVTWTVEPLFRGGKVHGWWYQTGFPLEDILQPIDALAEWGLQEDPEGTAAACDRENYSEDEVFPDEDRIYALHPTCGRHLASLLDQYLADTGG